MVRVRRPRARGCPSAVRAVTSTVPVQRIASIAFGPTRGPASNVTPVVAFDAAASVASTNTVNIGDEVSMVAPSLPVTASWLIDHRASALRVVRDGVAPVPEGKVSPLVSRASMTVRPAKPGRRPVRRHADSSRFGWIET